VSANNLLIFISDCPAEGERVFSIAQKRSG